ncbi:MAG: nicotinamide riboside transporter PnuC [Acutalibacteraceae bacterium]
MAKKDWVLWIASVSLIVVSNILSGDVDLLTLTATCIGVTSLVFAAMGNVWSPVLMTVFSILYAIISYRFRYWGEMITYALMTLPMSVWAIITWAKNSGADNNGTVKIRKITPKIVLILTFFTVLVTAVFYYILKALDTPNLFFSTVSIATSFLAASLTMLRSSYYALCYASNDLVLIVLWILASAQNPVYIPVVVNFVIFFVNDMYGFICWKKREAVQG